MKKLAAAAIILGLSAHAFAADTEKGLLKGGHCLGSPGSERWNCDYTSERVSIKQLYKAGYRVVAIEKIDGMPNYAELFFEEQWPGSAQSKPTETSK